MDADAERTGAVLVRAMKFPEPLVRRFSVRPGAGAHRSALLLSIPVRDAGRKPVMALPRKFLDLEHALVPSPFRDLMFFSEDPGQAKGQGALQFQLRQMVVDGRGILGCDQPWNDLSAAS